MSALLRRSGFRIVNQSSVPTLLKHIQNEDGRAANQSNTKAAHAQTLLHFVSKHCAAIYKPRIGELIKAIIDEKNVTSVEVGLNALASVLKWDTKLGPTDRSAIVLSFSFLMSNTILGIQKNPRPHRKICPPVKSTPRQVCCPRSGILSEWREDMHRYHRGKSRYRLDDDEHGMISSLLGNRGRLLKAETRPAIDRSTCFCFS